MPITLPCSSCPHTLAHPQGWTSISCYTQHGPSWSIICPRVGWGPSPSRPLAPPPCDHLIFLALGSVVISISSKSLFALPNFIPLRVDNCCGISWTQTLSHLFHWEASPVYLVLACWLLTFRACTPGVCKYVCVYAVCAVCVPFTLPGVHLLAHYSGDIKMQYLWIAA